MAKSAIKKKWSVDPVKLEQIQFNNIVRTVFQQASFVRLPINGKEFQFRGRTGELDDIFIYENIIVLCEYTIGKASSVHLGKKKFLFDAIMGNCVEWVDFLQTLSVEFREHFDSKPYSGDDYRVRIVYCSKKGINEEIINVYPEILYIDYPQLKYFRALAKIIHRTSRFELFKFLNLEHSEIGASVNSSAGSNSTYPGFLLPEGNSSFPPGYKIVSFYADPQTLLERSYVLRRDSWRDPEGLYQRLLIPGKIRKMRQYLDDVKRVFVNNIIVTLPNETKINNPDDETNLKSDELKKVRNVSIQIPNSFNVIGIIDGQHRILCYHEGTDALDGKIEKLRNKQNLLVTGIIYPKSLPQHEKIKFEARLFLEVNDTQTSANASLRQSIEVILRPKSTIAIAKSVIERLSRSGALKDLLQVHQFDESGKIKTSSIVSYGLRPLVKFDGSDSLFSIWDDERKGNLLLVNDEEPYQEVLNSYVEFCAKQINNLLLAAKMCWGINDWKLESENRLILSPTAINGFIVCLRLLISSGLTGSKEFYEEKLQGIADFPFDEYKSSHWKSLGERIFDEYFAKNI